MKQRGNGSTLHRNADTARYKLHVVVVILVCVKVIFDWFWRCAARLCTRLDVRHICSTKVVVMTLGFLASTLQQTCLHQAQLAAQHIKIQFFWHRLTRASFHCIGLFPGPLNLCKWCYINWSIKIYYYYYYYYYIIYIIIINYYKLHRQIGHVKTTCVQDPICALKFMQYEKANVYY